MKSKIKVLELEIDKIKEDYKVLTLLEMEDKYNTSESTLLKLFEKYNITKRKDLTNERIGQTRINKQGFVMEVIEYNNCKDVKVKFLDNYNTTVKTDWVNFDKGSTKNPNYRLGEKNISKEGYLMKIIHYTSNHDVIIEFQDEYHAQIHTEYKHFKNGSVKNPFHKSLLNVGVLGNKYPNRINGKFTKEYNAWRAMVQRCYDEKLKNKFTTYSECTMFSDWLYFPNFYEWLHSQENFEQWKEGNWNLDKDILVKGNKLYSPETCCLVPHHINVLFVRNEPRRGNYPIGVTIMPNGMYQASCSDPFELEHKPHNIGYYYTAEDAFYAYKRYKENIIRQLAEEEYNKGTITKRCYNAMMNYEVEITD